MSVASAAALTLVTAACLLNRLNGFMPETRVVYGTLTNVDHDERYEAPCGVVAHVHQQCGELPYCCAYYATVTDTLGRAEYFWFFAPVGNTIPHVGTRTLWRLHRREVWELGKCSYRCPSETAYALDEDSDIGPR